MMMDTMLWWTFGIMLIVMTVGLTVGMIVMGANFLYHLIKGDL